MRVALVGPYPIDTDHLLGGVETSFFNLLQGLSSFDDVEPHVVTFDRGAKALRFTDTGPAPATYLPANARLNNLTLYRADRRLLHEALGRIRPDIVHAQDALGYGYVSLKVAQSTPVIVTIHGIVREELRHMVKPLDRIRTSLARVPVQRYCIRNARYLIEPSRYPEEYFQGEIRGSIVDVGNAISDLFFEGSATPERGRILYAGGITPGKRVLDLVDAFAAVHRERPEATLRLAGHTADRPYVQTVTSRIHELGLDDQVTFLGNLTPEELRSEYRCASVFVLPSAQENSPMVIREAMAVGVPVVATRVGGVHYLVEEGKTGFLVDVGDSAAIATRAIQLIGDETARKALGEAARTVAGERFQARDVAARVRDVYVRVLLENAGNTAAAKPAPR